KMNRLHSYHASRLAWSTVYTINLANQAPSNSLVRDTAARLDRRSETDTSESSQRASFMNDPG
ncbi:MAG TPA: hypothetical protein VGA33_03950, partial [Thermoanaerobaculia bacterium]